VGKTSANPTLRLIHQVVEDRQMRDASDHDLLQRFRNHRDHAAFHALVCRHGTMVLDVCRGVLGNEANAEDAFQATFLILARKAGAIRKAASVGCWLHSVAYRTALHARAQEATRKKIEARVPTREYSGADDLTWREVRAVLHEELNKLPERYRAALVMCYLESLTQDQAAARLGVAKSTLKERLERGRQLLGTRLVRRGLGPPAVLVAAAWPAPVCSACLPLSLVSATVKAAGQSVAGQATGGAISANVAAWTQGVLKMMLLTKLKTAAAGVALLVALVGGSGLVYRTAMATEPDEPAGTGQQQDEDPDLKRPQPVDRRLKQAEAEFAQAREIALLARKAAEQAKAKAEQAEDRLAQAEARLSALRENKEPAPAVGRSVTLDDGARMPLDPTGLLLTKELRGRFVVSWDGPLTVAEADGPIRVRLRDTPLTLDLRTVAGERQAVVRVRAVGGDAPVELRLRRAGGKDPVQLEFQPVQADHEAEVLPRGKAVRLALRPGASEIEVEAVKGAVTTRVIQPPGR
jgi:RNA polymerase sigma factor (sigma-70 family)